jgi:hypothetical protein
MRPTVLRPALGNLFRGGVEAVFRFIKAVEAKNIMRPTVLRSTLGNLFRGG